MTGPETFDIKALEAKLLKAFREEIAHEMQAVRDEMRPAIRLAASVTRISEALADIIYGSARFLKWGVGVGAGLATIYVAFHAAGIV